MRRTLIAAAVGLCSLFAIAMAQVLPNGEERTPPAGDGGAAAAAYQGYCSSIYGGDCFLAAGTGGRLDFIFPDQRVESLPRITEQDLTNVWTDGAVTLVCGKKGTILRGDGENRFALEETGTKEDVFGVTYYNGVYIACAGGGTILYSVDGGQWETRRLPTQNDVIAIASNSGCVMAITAQSDIFTSFDGQSWEQDNFNDTYEGYYDPFSFDGIKAMGESLFLFGHLAEDPGKPILLYTERGEVWMEKPLVEINGEAPDESYPLSIHMLGYDADQLLAVCDQGRLLTIPNCAKCNQLLDLSDKELRTLAFQDGKLLAAGEDFSFQLLDAAQVRQDQIKAEQALEDMQNGAVIIDVREADELAQEGYITGSLSIPLAEIPERLPQAVPDQQTELIFYCAKGARAQQALEEARGLGYERVYNLGGIGDWPYEITR